MESKNVTFRWSWEAGRIWAVSSDGRQIPAWPADVQFAGFADVLNSVPSLSAFFGAYWEGLAMNAACNSVGNV